MGQPWHIVTFCIWMYLVGTSNGISGLTVIGSICKRLYHCHIDTRACLMRVRFSQMLMMDMVPRGGFQECPTPSGSETNLKATGAAMCCYKSARYEVHADTAVARL